MDEAKVHEIKGFEQVKQKNIEILNNFEGNIDDIRAKWVKNLYKEYKPIDFSYENSFEIKYIKMTSSILMELRQTGCRTLLDYMVLNEYNNRQRPIQ